MDFRPTQYPRPYPSRHVPIYALPPESKMPVLTRDLVPWSYTPLDTHPHLGALPYPDMLDSVDYPEFSHPSYDRPSYLNDIQTHHK